MNILLLSLFLTFFIGAEMLNSPELRHARSADEKNFEEKVEEGYELLKDQPHVHETKELVLQLHKMEKEIKDQLIHPEDPEISDEEYDTKEESDHIQPTGDSIEEINQKSKVAITLYQGDIVVTQEQVKEILEGIKENKGNRNKRQAIRDRYHNNTWSNGVFYYFYSNTSNATRRLFKKAASEWENETCINFYENETAPDRIGVHEAVGCWSEIGRIGGEQGLSLGFGCNTIGNALHEIGHALGFYHTHSRHDRNKFIRFYPHNIESKYVSQFTKETKRTNDNYNLTYDYGSVMHYGARGASKNRKPVMIPHDKKYLNTMGSSMISFYDKLMMNTHYGCLANCKEGSSAECQNGGFPHPRNCSKCICPSGYGGRLCHQRPKGCGRTLTAANFSLTLRSEVGKKGDGRLRNAFSKCYYLIEAPTDSKIEVEIESIQDDVRTDGCSYAGVEIKTGSDKRLTGYRFCSKTNKGMKFVSEHNVVPIITYSNIFSVTFVLNYRIAPSDSSEISDSTTQAISTAKSRCRESNLCPKLLEWNDCNSTKYEKFIKEICPQSCGYCPPEPIS